MKRRSIRTRLLQWLLLPLFCIACLTTGIAYALTFELVREIYDMELLNSADSIITRAVWTPKHEVKIDLPPKVMEIMGHDGKDDFYFQLFRHGKPICGNHENLPVPAHSVEPAFTTRVVDGEELRLVSMLIPEEENGPDDVMLTVAETGNTRNELIRHLFCAVMIPQFLLIVCGCTIVWFGIDKGLRELEQVRRDVSGRSPIDLKPVDADVPLEVSPLIDALNRLFAGVEEDMEKQRRFTANAAHQLRTPLAGLGTYCDLAIRYAADGKVKDILLQMHVIVSRMTSLVNQLLSLARCESASTVSRIKKPVDLNAIASEVTAELVPLAIHQDVELEFEPDIKEVTIYGDAPSLHEMIKNLVDNAIKYTPGGGRVVVGLSQSADQAILYVDDTGIGIPEGERQRIFERFYRVADTAVEGTGLGLSIVQDVVNSHEASVNVVVGDTGKGSHFEVHFTRNQSSTGQFAGPLFSDTHKRAV